MPDETSYPPFNSTFGGSISTMTLIPTTAAPPKNTERGLFATAAVQTKDGWLSQVIVDREIIREFGPFKTSAEAMEAANSHIVKRIRKLFA